MEKAVSLNMRLLLILIIISFFSGCVGIGKGARLGKIEKNYTIYNRNGVESDFDAMIQASLAADVLFIGESHGDPVAREMELDLLKTLHKKMTSVSAPSLNKTITLALEFFEKDVQVSLDEYLKGQITEKHFTESARAWPNYQKDYRDLIEYAKENKMNVIAANAPRRYVNMVSRQGRDSLDALSDNAKTWLPPLPYGKASDAYMEKLDQLNKTINEKMKAGKKNAAPIKKIADDKAKVPDPKKMRQSAKPPFIDHNAQSLWDASMAWSISESLKQSTNAFVININGNFHSENRLGIPEHLLHYHPEAKIVVVTIKPVERYPALAEIKKRSDDFIVYSVSKVSGH